MARDYYNEVKGKNTFSKNPQKKKKKDEKKTEVVKKPQSSVSVNHKSTQPVRQTDTGIGSRRISNVSRGSQQTAKEITNAASQVIQRRPDRNKPAQTAKQMQEQRQAKRLKNENVRKQNAAEWETVKNKSKQEQQAWFTEKAKEAQIRRNGKVSEGTDNLATSAFKAAAHGAKGAVHSLSGALERASMNDTAEAYRFKFDEMRKGTSEAEAEKIGLQKAQQRQEARLAGYREKTKLEQQKIETIQNREAAKDKGPIPLRKMTVGAATFTGQRLVDSALGPYSLLSMGARVIEDERNSGKEKNDQLKKRLIESGQFSQEELDETFAQIDRKAVANAYASSGIEVLSELMFGGIGLSKKYLPKGASGMLDKAAGKLFGRLGTTAAGRIALGIGEETAEEWIANPLQAAVSNRMTGNTLQSLQEESVRRTYKDQARSLEEIQATSADINSKAFLDRAKEVYKEAGASDKEATQIAELARDYFNADITGDSKTAEEKLNQITDILAGGENDLREKWTLKDALEVAGEMIISVGAEATPGAISMSTSGGQYKANYGIEGVRKLAKVVENLDDEKSDRAKAIIDDIDNGKDISNTQVAMLMEWSNNAALKAQDREITRDQVVQRKMRDENLFVPIVDTQYNLAPATEERFEQIVEGVADMAQEDMGLDMNDVDAYAIGDVVAAYETGTISAEQMNELNIENPENRAVFEKATGIDLNQYTVKDSNGNIKVAASNTAMQKALFAKAADNYIKSARIEQENWNDVERGQAYERLTSNDMGGRGDMAISRVLDSVDPRNRGEFMLAGSVARRVYEHARMTDDSWDEVKKDFTNTFSSGMNESMKYVYEMAKADKAIAENKYYGKVTESGEKATKSSLKEQAYVPGKFTNDSERVLKSSELSVLTSVASELGLNVIMTDSLDNNENGRYMYKSRTIMLNSQNTMDENLEAIFSHEVTHHLAAYAPDEYLKLSRYVMDRYYKSDRDSFMKEIKEKQDLYKKAKGQELTPEEALEEMIADGSRDFWQDQDFIDAVTQEEPTLAKKILDSLKDILRKLRNILSSGNITDEQTREGFFNQINAYDEAYRLWLNAYNAARSAQATETINETQNQINEQSDTRQSLGEEAQVRFSISEQQNKEYMDTAKEYQKLYEADDPGWLKLQNKLYKMVDEAAIANGYNIKAYHGTDAEPFNVFDRDKLRHGRQYGDGFYFSPYEEVAGEYGDDVREYYLKGNGQELGEFYGAQDHKDFDTVEEAEKFFDEKYKQFVQNGQGIERFRPEARRVDGKYRVIYTTIGSFQNDVILVATEPEYIKSADIITYDDEGSIIPLSERFNEESQDVRYSIVEYSDEEKQAHIKAAADQFGTTRHWERTGYITTDGYQLDFGQPNTAYKQRAEDHRYIGSIYENQDFDTATEQMLQFMSEGNIRVIPEMSGLDFSSEVEPTEDQYYLIRDYVNRYAEPYGELTIEFTNINGGVYTVDEKYYEGRISADQVINDIKRFYKEGAIGGSNLNQFRYSLNDNNISSYSTGAYSGQVNMRTEYKDGDNVLGYVDWNDYEGTPNISYIEVNEENRRQGIARKLLQNIQGQYPNTAINFGMTTTDGTALLDAITYEEVDEDIKAKETELKEKRKQLEDIGNRLNELYDKDELTEEEDAEIQKIGREWDALNREVHDLEDELEGQTSTRRMVRMDEDNRYSLSDEEYEAEVNQSMTMDQCRQMVQRCFVLGDIKTWYDGKYKNGDEWLRGEGAEDVAMIADNEWTIQEKYLNKIGGLYREGLMTTEEILEAYLAGTLTGKEKPKAKRLDTSQETGLIDTRFYAPQTIEDAVKAYEVATKRITKKNRAEVIEARGKVLLFAHNEGAEYELGLTRAELNKKLKSWAGYSAKAREVSQRINKGVAAENRWTGIENMSWLVRTTVSEDELANLVKSIEGESGVYERSYIARAMLALDTHIDWHDLSFVFKDRIDENRSSVRGHYIDKDRLIEVKHMSPHTVAHEMGHALDAKWGRDIGSYTARWVTEDSSTGLAMPLTHYTEFQVDKIQDEDVKQFAKNFLIFIDSISDVSDLASEYSQRNEEVFARFVDQFCRWTGEIATGYRPDTWGDYNDKFTQAHYVEFARLLQEKASLDSKVFEKSKNAYGKNSVIQFRDDIRYSLKQQKRDDEYMAAVESGDMETAQKLVEIAAKEAGKSLKVYHGTTAEDPFYVFRKPSENTRTYSRGSGFTYVSPSYDYAEGYSIEQDEEIDWYAEEGRVMEGFINTDNMLDIGNVDNSAFTWTPRKTKDGDEVFEFYWPDYNDENAINSRADEQLKAVAKIMGMSPYEFVHQFSEAEYEEIKEGMHSVFDFVNSPQLADFVRAKGYEGIKLEEWGEDAYGLLDSNQFKSADPVTYAEDGSVIPLSQRFDPNNDDIRYSLPTQDTNGKVLSDGQMEYFRNSQARGEGGKLVPVYHTTRKGGFTIFDPEHSDDKRSLFFASNWFVSQTYARNAYNPIDLNRRDKDQDVTLEEFLSMDQEHGAPGLVATRIIDIVDTETGEVLYDNSNFTETGNALVEWYNAAREGKAKQNIGVTVGGELMDYEGFVSWMNNTMDEWYGRGTQRGYYSCYLNLVNPMMVDAHYSYWNSIPYSPGASVEEVIEKLNHYAGYKINRVRGTYQLNGSKYRLIVEGAKQDFSTRTWTPIKIDEEFPFDIDEVFAKGNTVNLQHALEDIWFKEFGGKMYDHMDLFFERLLDDLRITQTIFWSNELGERDFGGAYFTSDGFRLNPVDYGYREKRYTTRQLAEIAQDKGYDGVIIRDCYDLSNASSFKGENRLSDIYIAFSSEQVKDINNLDPTNNPDIRYSVVDDDEAMSYAAHDDAYDDSWEAMEYYESVLSSMVDIDLDDGFINHPMQVFMERLKKYGETDAEARRGRNKYKYRPTKYNSEEDWTEAFYEGLTWQANEMRFDDPVLEEGRTRMAKSRNDFFNSTVAKWNQGWVTEGSVLDINSIKKPVRDLVAATMQGSDTDRKYNSDTVKKTLIDMRLAYWYAQQGRIDIADAMLWNTAHRIIENVQFYTDDSLFNEYKDLRQYLRTTRIQLGEKYWADVDYQAFRKANCGRMKLVSGETNVAQIYAELEELFPGLFNSEEYTTPPDQLMHMAAVLDSIQPYKEAYSSEECAALATEIASDLLDIMQNEGKAIESVADKYEAKIQAMRTRHAEAMLKVREQRDRGIKAEKAKFKEYVAKQKEKTLHKKHYQSIQNNYKKLTERLLTNTADKNIPEQYKKELAKLLGAFDLQTVGSKKYEARTGRKSQKTIRMGAMIAALSNIESKSGEFHVNDAITDIIDELLGKDTGSGHNRSIEGLTIDELNSSELARIDNLLKALLHEFNTYKTVKVKAKRQQVEDIGKAQVDSALKHAEDFGFGKDYNGAVGILDKIVNLDEMTASYLFRRIDPENEGLGLMYRELRLSFDHYVRNTAQLNQWMEQILGKYQNRGKGPKKYGSDQIDQWRSYNNARTLNLANGSVQLTPAQIMSIYCLAKRPQAYNHMTGAGIVVAPNRYDAKFINDIKQKVSTALPVKLTDADIKQVIDALTPDQMKVASDLQQLMANQMAAWGNEASMNVLGIELFNEPDYFPIKSDKAGLISDLNEDQFAEAIRSFGFTKAVQPGAKNAIMVDDIFTVVAEHCNNMNLYNSYSETINDFMKVYNYRDFDESRGEYTVKQAIAHAYSQKATAFISRFIKDLNGNVSGNDTGISRMYNDLLSKAKKASVFANGRVALQQPTAIARAFYVINPKYMKGIVTNERASQSAMKEMFEHCPIALWKSWGYYDIQMGRSVEDVMMNNGNWLEDIATDVYGALDNVTWAAIWQMVKAEMKDTHPDVKPGTDEYWELCNERMSEIVDLTQVVDSPMHRSHAMRSKGFLEKTATAFMSEPTLTFNMVKDGLIQAREALQKGNIAEASSIAGKTIAVFFFQAALVSGMAAIWDALRGKNGDDDDEDQSKFHLWWLNVIENFKDELKIWNKVYFVKDVSSLFQGYGINNLALQGWKSIADGIAQLTGRRNVYSSKTWYENLFGGIGSVTGVPIKTLMTDLKAIYKWAGLDWKVVSSVGDYLDATQERFSELFAKEEEDTMATSFWAIFDGKKNGASSQEDEKESKPDKKKSSGSEEETPEDIKSLSEDQLKKLDKKAEEKAKGYTGTDRDEVLWDVLSEGYTKHIEAGDMDYIYKLRVLYQKHGGNIDTFNTKVANAMPSIYKKTFKANMTEEEISNQEEMKEFMLRYGMSDAEVSDICYHTDMAKDLKAALRMNNREHIMDELVPLIRAGLTREDFERLYKNRNRGANTYSGKYTDEKYRQSTGNFVWPTEGTITSGYGYRGDDPTLPAGASAYHMGIDIGAALGTPVVACDGGVVIEAGANGGYGNSVGIKHDDGTISYYNHLYNWNVQVGDQVGQGQQIGQVGSTGTSSGPHLDFRLYKDGDYLNPMEYLNKRS